jgi:5-methylcytosine-specific restriction enzyme A
MNAEPEPLQCALCERYVRTVSRHHLVPKQKGGKHGPTIPLCQPCHSTLHATFTNKELATRYNSIDQLRSAPPLQTYLNWIRDKTIERIQNRQRKK